MRCGEDRIDRAVHAAAPVRISSVACVPTSRCSTNPNEVTTHGTLKLIGGGLRPGMSVVASVQTEK